MNINTYFNKILPWQLAGTGILLALSPLVPFLR